MKHRLLFYLLTLVIFKPQNLNAQYQNVWVFGFNAGIDFNQLDSNGFPTSIYTKSYAYEGTASVCDSEGNLLFYTDGVCVYNSQHQMMPGAPLRNLKEWLPPDYEKDGPWASTRSSSQTCIIIQYPGKESLYYLFSLTGETGGVPSDAEGRLYYSLIDMGLNNGLGGIVDTCNGVYFGDEYSEAITSILGNDTIWLIVPRKKTLAGDDYCSILAFPITSEGFQRQPVETILPNRSGFMGTIVPNNQGSKLALSADELMMLDFDKSSGRIKSFNKLGDKDGAYGLAFSSNDNILYTSGGVQINLETQERHIWNPSNGYLNYQLKLGPDKRIYFPRFNSRALGVITNPNEFGLLLDSLQTIKLHDTSKAVNGLPNVYNAINYKTELYQLCLEKGDTLWPHNFMDYFDVVWNDTLKADYFIPEQSGIYIAKYTAYGALYIDSFQVEISNDYQVFISHDSLACTETTNNLVYVYTNGLDPYVSRWLNLNNGDLLFSGDTVANLLKGSYIVNIQQGICTVNIPVNIYPKTFIPHLEVLPNCNQQNNGKAVLKILNDDINKFEKVWMTARFDTIARNQDTVGNLPSGEYLLFLSSKYCDTLITFYIQQLDLNIGFNVDSFWCLHHDYSIINISDSLFHFFNWYVNDSLLSSERDFTYTPNTSSEHYLKLVGTGEGCVDSVQHKVWVDTPQYTKFISSNNSICAGEKITFTPLADESVTELRWMFGKSTFVSYNTQPVDQAFEYPGEIVITLHTSYRACPDIVYTDSVIVHDLPLVDLGTDDQLCLHGKPILLENKYPSKVGNRYLWSTGEQTKEIYIRHHGAYWLQVTNDFGCTTTERVMVEKDCNIDIPNAFTPNGDGLNDYFFPRQLLSRGIASFRMEIYNRRGQKVFESTSFEGRGWDGRFNGVNQPLGVYVYQFDVVFKNGQTERYTGNVTLMR